MDKYGKVIAFRSSVKPRMESRDWTVDLTVAFIVIFFVLEVSIIVVGSIMR